MKCCPGSTSGRPDATASSLKGVITEADLPEAEREWPGLLDFFRRVPPRERPTTFLELVWRFEGRTALLA
jgi:hypothetical protein